MYPSCSGFACWNKCTPGVVGLHVGTNDLKTPEEIGEDKKLKRPPPHSPSEVKY